MLGGTVSLFSCVGCECIWGSTQEDSRAPGEERSPARGRETRGLSNWVQHFGRCFLFVSRRGVWHHIPAPTWEGCRRSSGWALVLLARLSLALVGGVVVSVVSLSEGAVPRTGFSAGFTLFSSGTSVPCTRSPESAGHFVKNSVTDQMVGSRRSPGATILGSEYEYLICQPSLFSPADRSRTP